MHSSFHSKFSDKFGVADDMDPHPGRMICDGLRPHLQRLTYMELERCGHYPWVERHASAAFYSVLRAALRR